jgi:hypothetical protein
MTKKGELFHFNWIFVSIAGAIILIFFITFALQYKGLKDEQASYESLALVDDALNALKSSSYSTVKEINVPLTITFNCDSIEINKISQSTNKFIFAPKEVSNTFVTWSNPLILPYKVTNLYYIIGKTDKFYLVYDQNSAEYVNQLIQEAPTVIQSHLKPISADKTPKDGKLIYFTSNAPAIQTQVTILDGDIGTITLVKDKKYFFNKEMLYAAIFSDNYHCQSQDLITYIKESSKVYLAKATILKQQTSCDYTKIISKLTEFSTSNEATLANLAKEIDVENKDLSSRNCPTLY